jgi:membrane associated rhomboid family serine protease
MADQRFTEDVPGYITADVYRSTRNKRRSFISPTRVKIETYYGDRVEPASVRQHSRDSITPERRSESNSSNDEIHSPRLSPQEGSRTSNNGIPNSGRFSPQQEESRTSSIPSTEIVCKKEPLLLSDERRRNSHENKNSTEEGETPAYLPPRLTENRSIDSVSLRDRYQLLEMKTTKSELPGMSVQKISTILSSMDNSDASDVFGAVSGTGTDASTNANAAFDDYTVDDYTVDDYTVDYTVGTAQTNTLDYKSSNSRSMSDGESLESYSIPVEQEVAWTCILLSAAQFGVLITQILMCGVATISVNPMIGPYPDAFSEWGGKNTYLLVEDGQYYRFITPIFLHVGFLHLLVNVFFQLQTCSYLEREWGFLPMICIYLISGFGSCLAASAIDPNEIGVCSSGALMGIFGAKIAQAITWSIFTLDKDYRKQANSMFERLGGVGWSATLVFLLTFFTYIDWSGHLGGLVTGFLVGMIYFSYAIASKCCRAIWLSIGIIGLVGGGSLLGVVLFNYTEADEELADACDYFRNLYPEGYACECSWDA